MLISQALAQTATTTAPAGGGLMIQLLPILFIFLIFYFLLIRPQQKRMREHTTMTQSLSRGDRVVTAGGIIATVIRAPEGENEITLELTEGVRVKVMRSTITTRLIDEVPAEKKAAGGKKDKKAA